MSTKPEDDNKQNQKHDFVIINGIVQPPTRPEKFLSPDERPAKTNISRITNGELDDEGEQLNFFEPISYKKLIKTYAKSHPVDPETQDPFSLKDRISVKDYYFKMFDCCFFYQINQKCKQCSKWCKKKCGKSKVKFEKPLTMKDQQDSDSNESNFSEEEQLMGGITVTAMTLGEGAALYLQLANTIIIMFFFLTLINIPVYILYQSSTTGNDFTNLNTFFSYFTLGNLGQGDIMCSWSDFNYQFDKKLPRLQELTFNCEEGYISSLETFGFLYNEDKNYKGFSDGYASCDHIMNPSKNYQYQPLKPIICNLEEDDQTDGCLLQKKMNNTKSYNKKLAAIQRILEKNITDKQIMELDKQYLYQQNLLNCSNNLNNKIYNISNKQLNFSSECTHFYDDLFDEYTDNDIIQNYIFNQSNLKCAQDQNTNFIQLNKCEVELTSCQGNYTKCDPSQQKFINVNLRNCSLNQTNIKMDMQNCSVNLTDKIIQTIQVSKKVNYTQIELEPVVSKYNIDPECQYYDTKKLKGNLFQNMDSFKVFKQYFKDNCFNQTNCTFDSLQMGQLGLWNLITPGCKNRMNQTYYPSDNVTSPIYIATVGCKNDRVQMPFTTGNQFNIHKLDVGLVLICFDMLSFFIIMYFINQMKNFNDEYIQKIELQIVSMKDFGIRIDKLLLDKYSQDQRLVRMKIWLHFTNVLKDRIDNYNDMECIDVCLSLYNEASIQLVFRMQEVKLEINEITASLKAGKYKYDEVPDKQIELNSLIEKIKRFEARYKKMTQKEKSNPDKLQVMKIAKNQKIKEIDYVFVIFKNSKTKLQVIDIFGDKSNAALNFLKKIVPEDNNEAWKKLLFGKEPNIVDIIEPDEIIWENLGYTGDQQKVRNIIMKIIQILSIIINIMITIYIAGIVQLINNYIPNLKCPTFEIEKQEAYIDLFKPKPAGFMGCWCNSNTNILLIMDLIQSNFQEFSYLNYKLNPPLNSSQQNTTAPIINQDTHNYCLRWWLLNYTKQIALFILGLSAVFINEIIAIFFKFMGQFQKSHTRIEEQILAFQKIFFMEYINMGLIILVASFDSVGIYQTLLGDLASSKPFYNGFETGWYLDYGNKICISIFMSSIILNVNEIREYVKVLAKRCFDRKGKMNLKLDALDEDCDLPNTQKKIQKDLVDLYTGKGFTGEKVFSRLMSTMFVIVMYSSGIPIFYLIGLAFFSFTYITNKYMLIYYFKKSTTLTKNVPIFGIDALQYTLYIHLIVSVFMFTDTSSFMTRSTEGSIQSPIDFQKYIHILLKQNSNLNSTDEIQQKKINPIVQILLDRIQFLHQQLIIGFALLFLVYKLIGTTVFGVLQLIGSQLIKCIQSFIEKQRRKASQAILIQMRKMQTNQDQQLKEQSFDNNQKVINDEIRDQEDIINLKNNQQSIGEKQQQDITKKDSMKQKKELIQLQRQQEQEEKEKYEELIKSQIAQTKLEYPDYSDNIYAEFNPQNLSNLYQKSKRELVDFWDIFQWDKIIGDEIINPESQSPYRILFLETCYTFKITQQDVIDYQDFLLGRISKIEKQVNTYFEMLKPQLIKKIQESFARDQRLRKKNDEEGTLDEQLIQKKYEDWYFIHSNDVQWENQTIYSIQKKLKLLNQFYDDLIKLDKQSKFNRKGIQTICRMQGSNVQSYFILDSEINKVGRSIYFSFESTIPYEEGKQDKKIENQSETENYSDDIEDQKNINEESLSGDSDHKQNKKKINENKNKQILK